MAFKGTKGGATSDSIPAMLQSGDDMTLPSNETKITPADGAASDAFGTSVAVGEGIIAIGSPSDGDAGAFSGSVYIFDFQGNQILKLTASDAVSGDNFGNSVAINHNIIVVGAPFSTTSGAAYVFDLNGTELAKLTPSDGGSPSDIDLFGWSVAVGSGRIVVGSYSNNDAGPGTGTGAAYVFDLNGTELKKIIPFDGVQFDQFGRSVAVGSDRIIIGSQLNDSNGSNSGAAYIYDMSGNLLKKIIGEENTNSAQFGKSIVVGSGRIIIGSGGSLGSLYIFDLEGTRLSKIIPSDGEIGGGFGTSVAVGSGRIISGAPRVDDGGISDAGTAYILDMDGNEMSKVFPDISSTQDFFGDAVAVGEGRIVVGVPRDDDNGTDSGSAYIYSIPNVISAQDLKDREYG